MQLHHQRAGFPEDMLTIDEVAGFLRVHPVTIRRWAKQNRLQSCRIGPKKSIRFMREDISAFIAQGSKSITRVERNHEEGFRNH